jgi:hypothetical protein
MEDLQKELNESLDTITKDGKSYLEQVRLQLDKEIINQIRNYSDEIKSIMLISGTVAPFSLTLLDIQNLETNKFLLLTGFSILICNILVAQFFLTKLIKNKDIKISKAELSWLFATFNLQSIDNKGENIDRTKELPDYIKNTNDLNQYLNLSTTNIAIQNERKDINIYVKRINTLFFIGAMCIILSILYFPIINKFVDLLDIFCF